MQQAKSYLKFGINNIRLCNMIKIVFLTGIALFCISCKSDKEFIDDIAKDPTQKLSKSENLRLQKIILNNQLSKNQEIQCIKISIIQSLENNNNFLLDRICDRVKEDENKFKDYPLIIKKYFDNKNAICLVIALNEMGFSMADFYNIKEIINHKNNDYIIFEAINGSDRYSDSIILKNLKYIRKFAVETQDAKLKIHFSKRLDEIDRMIKKSHDSKR